LTGCYPPHGGHAQIQRGCPVSAGSAILRLKETGQ
jgi:hypothetical protein